MKRALFGSLVFGAWNHFVVSGPDHVAEVAEGAMGHRFQVTAVLLALIEAGGAWLGMVWFRRRYDVSYPE